MYRCFVLIINGESKEDHYVAVSQNRSRIWDNKILFQILKRDRAGPVGCAAVKQSIGCPLHYPIYSLNY